jgi:hypothetical protein
MRSGTRGGYFIGTEGIMHLQYYGEFEETPAGQMIKGNSHLDITQYHQKPETKLHEVYDWAGQSHFDGTEPVMLAKIDLLRGKPNAIAGTIREGYISAMICLAAQESIETGKVVSLDLED